MNEFKNINNYFSFVPLYNSFIENYMTKANPSFVVVYIYILKMFINGEDVYLDNVSNKLNILASDVIKALEYWQYEKIISYKQVENKVEITFFYTKKEEKINNNVSINTNIGNNINNLENTDSTNTEKNQKDIDSKKEEIKQVFRLAEKKFAKTLTYQDREVLIRLYEDYNMSMEILAVLFAYCAENGKSNFRYIEKIAIDWCENNIDSLEKVEAYLKVVNNDYKAIMKAFGINNRQPIKSEEDFMKTWLLKYKMPIPIIQEACKRTILTIGKVSFSYANGIIEDWVKNNVKTLDDIKKLDNVFVNTKKVEEDEMKKRMEERYKNKFNNNGYSKNRFLNYNQKEYDYELLKKIERMDLEEGIENND